MYMIVFLVTGAKGDKGERGPEGPPGVGIDGMKGESGDKGVYSPDNQWQFKGFLVCKVD